MRNTIKKIAASVMAATVLVVGMTSVSASAANKKNSYDIWLQKDIGAPGGAVGAYQSWNYTTDTTIEFDITTFTRSESSSSSYVGCYAAYEDGVVIINASLTTKSSLSASVSKGRNASASVTLYNYYSGSHKVRGYFYF